MRVADTVGHSWGRKEGRGGPGESRDRALLVLGFGWSFCTSIDRRGERGGGAIRTGIAGTLWQRFRGRVERVA